MKAGACFSAFEMSTRGELGRASSVLPRRLARMIATAYGNSVGFHYRRMAQVVGFWPLAEVNMQQELWWWTGYISGLKEK